MTATTRIDNRNPAPANGNSASSARSPRDALASEVHWFGGSVLAGLFSRLLLDQVAYREIAAAVDRSGRFAENFTDRALRSGGFSALMMFTDRVDAEHFRDLIKQLHRDVRGSGAGDFADTRYSALDPDLWKWIAVSSLNMSYQAYTQLCGRKLDADEREVVYQTLRSDLRFLELPSSKGKLPATLDEMIAYYEHVAATKLADNPFLQYARESFAGLPLPTLIAPPAPLKPLWPLLMRLAARPVAICSTAVAHPRMRELLKAPWRLRHRAEYRVYRSLASMAWRRLPRRLTLEPLAHNRYEYEKLRDYYTSLQLESFAPTN